MKKEIYKDESSKKELTLEEEFEEHMKEMSGHVCYGCSGCKFSDICPYAQEG